jgi:ribosome maturation protein SDO1
MSRQINQPINQVKLTNVAVVRLNRGGKRFEIACYKNKVVNYRQGLERDLSEVLQTERIFTNVSKGQFANHADLQKVFDTTDEDAIARLILDKGTMQVSHLEREELLESVQREVASLIVSNTVHPVSQRPYTVTQIRAAMQQAGFKVNTTKNVKRQYLECVKLLQENNVLPIERSKMELKLYYVENESRVEVEERLRDMNIVPSSSSNSLDESSSSSCFVLLVDPSLYRPLDEVAKEIKGVRLEIIRQSVQQEGDVDLEQELERRKQQQQQQQQQQEVESADSLLHDNDGEESRLATQFQQQTTLHDYEDSDDKGDSAFPQHTVSRKSQKKAQKKSKKAKRREKEEAVERQARVDAERHRQQERAAADDGMMGSTKLNDNTAETSPTSSNRSCNTCGGSFHTATEYRAHFKTDWHRYNVKLKMRGAKPVSEEEFRLCDSDAFFFGNDGDGGETD